MNLSGETGLKTSLQGKSMRVELGKRSFHPSDAFFDMDNWPSASHREIKAQAVILSIPRLVV
jgi:hypothetical protein